MLTHLDSRAVEFVMACTLVLVIGIQVRALERMKHWIKKHYGKLKHEGNARADVYVNNSSSELVKLLPYHPSTHPSIPGANHGDVTSDAVQDIDSFLLLADPPPPWSTAREGGPKTHKLKHVNPAGDAADASPESAPIPGGPGSGWTIEVVQDTDITLPGSGGSSTPLRVGSAAASRDDELGPYGTYSRELENREGARMNNHDVPDGQTDYVGRGKELVSNSCTKNDFGKKSNRHDVVVDGLSAASERGLATLLRDLERDGAVDPDLASDPVWAKRRASEPGGRVDLSWAQTDSDSAEQAEVNEGRDALSPSKRAWKRFQHCIQTPSVRVMLRYLMYGSFAGTAAGVMNGLTGIGGPPIIYLYDRLQVPKDVVRGTSAVNNVLQFRVIVYGVMGLIKPADAGLYVLCAGAALVGTVAGNKVASYMDQQTFRRSLVALMVACCLLLFASAAGMGSRE